MNAETTTTWSALSLLTALLLASTPAAATSRLDYRAPATCATEPDFLAAVTARGSGLNASSAAPDQTFEVSIDTEGSGFRGSFQVLRGGERSDQREVHGATCAEVVDALAVATAIALRPNRESTPPPPEPRLIASPSPAPDTTRLHMWPVPFQPKSKSIEVEAGTLRLDSVMNITASGGAAWGVIPHVFMPRYDLTLSRQNFVQLPNGEGYGIGPVWRFRASFLGDAVYHSPAMKTEVTGEMIGISPCYSPWFDMDGLELLFCSELAIGIVNVRTKSAAGATTQSKKTGLGTLGIGTELTYNLGRHFHLTAKLGADLATGQITAERPDGSQIFHSSSPSAHAMLGAGFHY